MTNKEKFIEIEKRLAEVERKADLALKVLGVKE